MTMVKDIPFNKKLSDKIREEIFQEGGDTVKDMKLIDPNTGLMECKHCGHKHTANIKQDSGGKYYRGSLECPVCKGKK